MGTRGASEATGAHNAGAAGSTPAPATIGEQWGRSPLLEEVVWGRVVVEGPGIIATEQCPDCGVWVPIDHTHACRRAA
jgi:hypothetical protein